MTLREYLDKMGLTQEAFAAQIGVTQPQISNYLRGMEPRVSVIARIESVTKGQVRAADFVRANSRMAKSKKIRRQSNGARTAAS